ncbi:hypothetical protein [Nocardia sp. NBC_01388]|uniref:hypothetical protein n=1 Tax=Nocardia sp. NBC_01388 TaxID=2903596 RepID=UPI003247C3BC
MPDLDLAEEQADEYARRFHQLLSSSPTELTGKDLEAIARVHRDACARLAAAELLSTRAELVTVRAGSDLLGAAIAEYNSIALAATGTVPDMLRGDGTTGHVDWQGVWEQVAELRPHLDAAHKRIGGLEAERDGYTETARQATALGIDQAARIAELEHRVGILEGLDPEHA